MGFIAEYTLSNPILQETRRSVPEMVLTVEDEQPTPSNPSRLIFWGKGDEDTIDRFFRELPTDPSITNFEILSTLPDRRLFRITLAPEAERGLTYVDAIVHGITFLNIEAQGEGIDYRAQVPSRDALLSYRKQCEERGLSFKLQRLYQPDDGTTAKYGITPRQQDVLRRALELGYYQVPREITMEELATEFDISCQALSTLLRRGHRTLLQSTVADGDST